MTRPRTAFRGTREQLDAIVLATGSAGQWEWMPAGFWQFKRPDGAILNWWPTTGTFNFQGSPAARDAFKLALITVVGEALTSGPALPSLGHA